MDQSTEKRKRSKLTANVVVDTRENKPWTFELKLPSNLAIGSMEIRKLDAGDYSLVGFDEPGPNSIIIERKQSLEEFLGNLGRHWERFERELEKLSQYGTALIIIEDDLKTAYSRFRKTKFFNMPPEFIIKRIADIQCRYSVSTHFLSNRTYAQKFCLNMFKYFLLEHGT
jgi:ERCC4-type nuclease